MKKEEIYEFIRSHDLAVVATINPDGKPQAAVVEFGEFPDLTITIDTLKTSRKYKNLQGNTSVAVVIGWEENKTVQMDGMAEELQGDKLAQAKENYFAKNPRAKKWADKPEIAYFAIKPYWIRYSDLNQHPWVVEEFDLTGNT